MGAFRHTDQSILFFLDRLGADGPLRDAIIRALATGIVYALLGILVYLHLKRPRGGHALALALSGAALAVVIGKVLNQVVARERPFVSFPNGVRHIDLIVRLVRRLRPDSFPSIHAAAPFGLAGAALAG